MSRFRATLSSLWGYKKNGKTGNGWLVIEDTGDILVKNIWRSDPLGNIGDIVDCRLDGKKVFLRNKFGDEIKLHMSRGDAKTFYRLISNEQSHQAATKSSDNRWEGLIQKLAELRDAGLLTEEEFAAKKAEVLRRV
jgi:hypothetical protein